MTKAVTSTLTPRFSLSPAWEGTLWKLFSCASFAMINGIVRYLSGGSPHEVANPLSVHVLMLFQNLFGTLLLLPIALKPGKEGLRTQFFSLHFIRVITAVAGVVLWYLTLQAMPIAEGIALTFTGPIFTIVGAWLLLHERLGTRRLIAIMLSLTGAFIISRPDLALLGEVKTIGYAVLFPLASAMVLALSKLMTRKLAALGEKPVTLATYLLLLMTPVTLPLALFNWTTPSPAQWPWLFLLGLLAAFSHVAFSKAYQLAEVTFLAPFGLFKFLLGGLVGYLAFQEFPTTWTIWLGISIILVSIMILSTAKEAKGC